MAKQPSQASWLHGNVVRLSRIHFAYVLAFIAQTIIYDAWHVVAPNAVLYRWIMSAGLAVVTVFVWYMAKGKVRSTSELKWLVWILILADIAAATLNIYSQRGMASRAVALYAIPIIIAAVLLSRAAIWTVTVLCIAAYSTAAVAYFVLNFNEGYKVELYGEVAFYSVIFMIMGALLWVVVRSKQHKPPR